MKKEGQDMADTITSWLQYKSQTGFNSLLNEASLTFPMAEFLVARYGTEVSAEVNHPALQSDGKKGRQAQIDFVRKKRTEKSWHAAFECKFQADNIYHIVYDLCRLCILSQDSNIGNPRRRFVYASKLDENSRTPLDKTTNAEEQRISRFDGILLREKNDIGNSLTFSIKNLPEAQRKPFRVFCWEYDVRIPSRIKIELSGQSTSRDFFCGVWTVKAVAGSVLRSHQELMNCQT